MSGNSEQRVETREKHHKMKSELKSEMSEAFSQAEEKNIQLR